MKSRHLVSKINRNRDKLDKLLDKSIRYDNQIYYLAFDFYYNIPKMNNIIEDAGMFSNLRLSK